MPEIIVPIFPLPNVVFFPKMFLPLHVFEPRYKQMVRDRLEEDRRFGIILLQEGWQADYFGEPPVHNIGCLGEIETYERLPEGRFNILLRGIDRFELLRFVTEKPYRTAAVKLLGDLPFLLEQDQQIRARDTLLEKCLQYFKNVLGVEIEEDRLDREASLETVVNQVASILDIPAKQKQTLLEAPKLAQRLELVNNIVDGSLQHANKLRRVVKKMKFTPEQPELN